MDWLKVGIAALVGGLLGAGILALIILEFAHPDVAGDSSQAAVMPKGAVVAWDAKSGCPAGWGVYSAAAGRMIAGSASNGYALGQTGGAATVSLSADQLPDHRHSFVDIYFSEKGGPYSISSDSKGNNIGSHSSDHDNSGWGIIGQTQKYVTKNLPHENMPPFIALLYCIKQ